MKSFIINKLLTIAFYLIGEYLKNDDTSRDFTLSYINKHVNDYLRRVK
jgi:hypothetical protein